jgi:hypothetical protein
MAEHIAQLASMVCGIPIRFARSGQYNGEVHGHVLDFTRLIQLDVGP